MNKILLSAPLAVLAGLAALGCRSTSSSKQRLNELGSIAPCGGGVAGLTEG
jgi:hypothetical protein